MTTAWICLVYVRKGTELKKDRVGTARQGVALQPPRPQVHRRGVDLRQRCVGREYPCSKDEDLGPGPAPGLALPSRAPGPTTTPNSLAQRPARTWPTWPRVCSTSRPTPANEAFISACEENAFGRELQSSVQHDLSWIGHQPASQRGLHLSLEQKNIQAGVASWVQHQCSRSSRIGNHKQPGPGQTTGNTAAPTGAPSICPCRQGNRPSSKASVPSFAHLRPQHLLLPSPPRKQQTHQMRPHSRTCAPSISSCRFISCAMRSCSRALTSATRALSCSRPAGGRGAQGSIQASGIRCKRWCKAALALPRVHPAAPGQQRVGGRCNMKER